VHDARCTTRILLRSLVGETRSREWFRRAGALVRSLKSLIIFSARVPITVQQMSNKYKKMSGQNETSAEARITVMRDALVSPVRSTRVCARARACVPPDMSYV